LKAGPTDEGLGDDKPLVDDFSTAATASGAATAR